MEEKIQKFQLLIALSVIAICILLSSMIFASKFQTNETVTVTGSASENVKSDSGKLSFEIEVKSQNQKQGYTKIKEYTPEVIEYLLKQGIEKNNIQTKAITGWTTYRQNPNGSSTNEVAYYTSHQEISITSNDVYKIRDIANEVGNLATDAININVMQPEYFYSGLGTIKIELLKEAAKDAKNRAKSMLSATGSRVGRVREMKMGVFQITPVDSTNVSDFGYNDTTTIDKKVTAVANVVFKVK